MRHGAEIKEAAATRPYLMSINLLRRRRQITQKHICLAMNAETSEGSDYYEHQFRAMSMCWPGFNSLSATSNNYSCQSRACSTLPMTVATQNDQQIIHQFRPCNFVSFAHFSTLSFDTINTPSTSLLSSSPVQNKKKAVPVPENLKDEAYRERRMKNNESARKSRELRRQKEESTQLRCDQLLHENHLLRTELSLLRTQMEQFRQLMSISSNDSQQYFVHRNSVPGL
uniref:BZIP domain-containing protein n=1 Tax=Setaria digitata TaxID=48799 RepID=A0A915Q584_9BILA